MNLTVVTRADQAASTNRQALKLSGFVSVLHMFGSPPY
jgi:hypothetical protein